LEGRGGLRLSTKTPADLGVCMAKIFALLLAIFIFQASVQAADKIRVGMPPDAGHFTFPLAQKSRFLKDEGFEAEIIRLVGPVANIALSNGDIDYFTGFASGMQAILRGFPARVVACYRPFPHFFLMARPEFKTIKELKGKTIGVTAFGGGPDLVGRLMIQHFGMDPQKGVKFVAAGSNEGRLIRMSQGLLDATVASFPWDFQGKKMGFNVLARSEDLFTYPISGVIAQTKKIKEKPD
jgi:NitT/TauT family transport system substrate-binding protein